MLGYNHYWQDGTYNLNRPLCDAPAKGIIVAVGSHHREVKVSYRGKWYSFEDFVRVRWGMLSEQNRNWVRGTARIEKDKVLALAAPGAGPQEILEAQGFSIVPEEELYEDDRAYALVARRDTPRGPLYAMVLAIPDTGASASFSTDMILGDSPAADVVAMNLELSEVGVVADRVGGEE